jgi:hypothetical protein
MFDEGSCLNFQSMDKILSFFYPKFEIFFGEMCFF